MTWLLCITSAAVGYVAGLRTRRMIGFCRKVYWLRRTGTCWRYQQGPRETRGGTNSCFCLRCGQPAGYHDLRN